MGTGGRVRGSAATARAAPGQPRGTAPGRTHAARVPGTEKAAPAAAATHRGSHQRRHGSSAPLPARRPARARPFRPAGCACAGLRERGGRADLPACWAGPGRGARRRGPAAPGEAVSRGVGRSRGSRACVGARFGRGEGGKPVSARPSLSGVSCGWPGLWRGGGHAFSMLLGSRERSVKAATVSSG